MAGGQSVIVIDIKTKFTDNMTAGMEQAKQSTGQFLGSIEKLKRQVDQLAGKKATPEIGLKDKASAALKNIRKNINTVINGLSAQKLIAGPIALADQFEASRMSLERMTGSAAKAAALMTQLKALALKTPFDTPGAASTARQMMGAGWKADHVVGDMTKIGNAAAANGQGVEGVQGIISAMKQMRAAGKVNSQDMTQLTDLGIKAWDYVAKAMGKTVPEVRRLSQEGLIPAETAIRGIIDGMGEYDGAMEKMSNQTVKGLLENLKETFDIKIVEQWGQGLAEGAKEGLGKLLAWLGQIDPMLEAAGTSLASLGEKISKGFFDIVGGITDRITEVLQSDDFLDAPSLLGKAKVIWDKAIGEPFSKWISEKAGSFGNALGAGLSDGLKTLLGMDLTSGIEGGASAGADFAKGFLEGFDGAAIGNRIKEIFKSALSEALKILPGGESPTSLSWISAAALAYGGAKMLNPVLTLGKGISTVTKAFTGKSLLSTVLGTPASGKGLLGRSAMAAIKMGAGNLASGGSLSAGALSAVGGLAVGGGVIGGVTLLSGISDLAKAMKTNDATLKESYMAKSNGKIGGVTAGAGIGAAIGSLFGGIGAVPGALIGAGIGGVVGWIQGDKKAEEIQEEARVKKRQEAVKNLKFSTKEMSDIIQDTSLSAEELEKAFEKACSKDLRDHFGDIVLSMEEIQKLSKSIVYGEDEEKYSKFSEASGQVGNAQSQLHASKSNLEKENWKAGLGIRLDKESQSALIESADTYIADAGKLIEERHYQVHCALDLLLEPSESADINQALNVYYNQQQTELNQHGAELKAAYKIYLENDGIITEDEAAEIAKIQNQISGIVKKIEDEKYETNMEVIRIKYSGGSLNPQNYQEFQQSIMANTQEKVKSLDEALAVSVHDLQKVYPEGGDEYEKSVQELNKNYHVELDKIDVDVTGFQVNSIADTYSKELDGILPEIEGSTEEKLMSGIRNAIATDALGKNPIEWDDRMIEDWFGLEKLPEEAKKNVAEMIKMLAIGLPEEIKTGMETDENLEKFREQYSFLATSKAAAQAAQMLPGLVTGMPMPAYPQLQLEINDNSEEAAKATKEGVDASLNNEFAGGIEKTIDVNFTMNPNIVNPKQNFICTGSLNYSLPKSPEVKGTGPDKNLAKTSHPAENAAGGFITGGRQLSWLDEEGAGEVVIPFNPSRRSRALSLYEETGRRLGVVNHADGGFVGRALSHANLKTENSSRKSAGSSKKGVTVQIAGISFDIKAGGSQQSILDLIESQRDEISSKISEILAEAFEDGFTNLPIAGSMAG